MTNEELEARVAELEKLLEIERRWAAYCMGRAIQHINEQVLKKDYLKQFKAYQ